MKIKDAIVPNNTNIKYIKVEQPLPTGSKQQIIISYSVVNGAIVATKSMSENEKVQLFN